LLQPLSQRSEAGQPFWICVSVRQQYADSAHPVGLLRPCRHRPRSRSANEANELASLHVCAQVHETASYRLK
jgi:hypothetical protein